MKTIIFSIFVLFMSVTIVNAETYCQSVNNSGTVVNATPLAQTMNKWLKQKGVDYKTSTKEVTNTVKNYCRSNPYGTVDDITDHLVDVINITATLLKNN